MEHIRFSERQWRIIAMVADGERNMDIATAMGTTEHVMKNYLRVIFDETGMNTRLELALWYWAIGEGIRGQCERGEAKGRNAAAGG